MQNQPPPASTTEVAGFNPPTPEEGLARARRRLAQMFQPGEQVWLLNERYDPVLPAWRIDVLRQGTNGRWVQQRYRFDTLAEVLHFSGERAFSLDEFRAVRKHAVIFSATK